MSEPIHPDAPKVILYTKPACGRCVATAKAFDNRGIEFVKLDVSEDENAALRVRDLGYLSLPVVVAGDMHWSGFDLVKIEQLAAALRKWEPSAPIEEEVDE